VLSSFGYLTRLEVWRPLCLRDPVLRSSCLVCDMFRVRFADGVLVSRVCASTGRDAREDAPPHREPAHPAAGLPARVQEGREPGASLVDCVRCRLLCCVLVTIVRSSGGGNLHFCQRRRVQSCFVPLHQCGALFAACAVLCARWCPSLNVKLLRVVRRTHYEVRIADDGVYLLTRMCRLKNLVCLLYLFLT
jgi:hypothetical protein